MEQQQITENTMVKLELPIGAVNVIMESLGGGVYIKVVGVIDEIKKQVTPQLQPPQPPQ